MPTIYEYSLKRTKVLEVAESISKASGAEHVYEYCKKLGWQEHEQEHLYALMLDSKNHIMGYKLITMGLVDRSHVHARELFRHAIVANSARIVMVHNHPSGDPTPSSQDISTTREMVSAGKVIGIHIMDHVILGLEDCYPYYRGYYSLKDNGFIK